MKSTSGSNNLTLGDRIVILRQERKITQEALAEKCGITPRAMSSIETGNSDPKIETLIKISEQLNCSIGYLLGEYNFHDSFYTIWMHCISGLSAEACSSFIKVCDNALDYSETEDQTCLFNLQFIDYLFSHMQALDNMIFDFSYKRQIDNAVKNTDEHSAIKDIVTTLGNNPLILNPKEKYAIIESAVCEYCSTNPSKEPDNERINRLIEVIDNYLNQDPDYYSTAESRFPSDLDNEFIRKIVDEFERLITAYFSNFAKHQADFVEIYKNLEEKYQRLFDGNPE